MHRELLNKNFKTGKSSFMKIMSKNAKSKNFNEVVSSFTYTSIYLIKLFVIS